MTNEDLAEEVHTMRDYRSLGATIKVEKAIFFDLVEFYILHREDTCSDVDRWLAKKITAMVKHEQYTLQKKGL